MTYRRFAPVCVSFLLVTFLIARLVAGTPSESAFKKLQSLAGKWEGKDAHGRAAKTSFEVLASGTAVMEKLEASGMEEMVTLYSVDRDGIALVHYCPTNNQPRMLVVPSSGDVKELSFDYQGAGNLASPSTGHQHHPAVRQKGGPYRAVVSRRGSCTGCRRRQALVTTDELFPLKAFSAYSWRSATIGSTKVARRAGK